MMSNRDSKSRLADWFRQWRVPLRKFLVGRGAIPASDLDDVAQEVFLRLMRYDRTELIEHPQAYLYKMASNVAAEWAIRGRYVRPHESKWLAGLSAEDRPEDEASQVEIQDEVERALLTLPPRQREVLRLQFFEGLSRMQIAERIGTSERSVKRTLIKSYEMLRVKLDAELLKGVTDGRE
jgi:RNA polymerase sigma-70 factor (ECF subfamily)